jgi:hypothetical protein
MFSRSTLLMLLAGFASGALFCFVIATNPASIFLTTPILVLLLAGFAYGAQATLRASLMGLVTVLALGASSCADYAVLIVLPALFFVKMALLWQQKDETTIRWYPVAGIIAGLSVMVCAIFMFASIMLLHEGDSLQKIASSLLQGNLPPMDPDMKPVLDWIMHEGSFLQFVLVGWMWVILVWVMALIAHQILAAYGAALRPQLRLEPNGLPWWLLALLFMSGALGVLGHGNDRFAGVTVFCMLLLPYFFAGIALLHLTAGRTKRRFIWLTLFYIALATLLWPALILAVIGVYRQVAEMLDRTP